MNEGGGPLIRLEDVSKVFTTDEVETHALSGISLDAVNERLNANRRLRRTRARAAVPC